jgi:hypothetical protein
MGVKVSFLAYRSTTAAASMIVLPKAAIMTDGHESFVWTVRNGTLRKKPIVRARELETGTEIKQGVDVGEVVVVAPTPELRVGQTVIPAGTPVR